WQHFCQVLHYVAKIKDSWFEHLFPTESQQLASHRGGFGASILDAAGVFNYLLGVSRGLVQKLCVPADNHEQVVEIVGDSARQSANGFHLLGVLKLLLERSMFGNILNKDFEPARKLVIIWQAPPTESQRYRFSVFTLPLGLVTNPGIFGCIITSVLLLRRIEINVGTCIEAKHLVWTLVTKHSCKG